MDERRAHVVHIVHRLDTGGMENGLVNLVNRLPAHRFRHTIVSLTGVGAIAARIANREVEVVKLERRPGPLSAALPQMWRLFRKLRPALVHTRNVGTLEAQVAAALANVPVRVHGEHGWEVHDIVGSDPSLLRTRRWLRHVVHAQVALSQPTCEFLRDRVGVPEDRLHAIDNGVDTELFRPRKAPHEAPRDLPALGAQAWGRSGSCEPEIVVGYVGRLADVKNPLLLLQAFERLRARLHSRDAALAARLRLAMIGHGPLAEALQQQVARSGARESIWLAGDRQDIPQLMRSFDLHALPSIAEGINNTLLEAMASGIPSVATRVGGNPELVVHGRTGTLVDPEDADAFADALEAYVLDAQLRETHGQAARLRAVERFSLDAMVEAYQALYTKLLVRRRVMPEGWPEVPEHAVSERGPQTAPRMPAG